MCALALQAKSIGITAADVMSSWTEASFESLTSVWCKPPDPSLTYLQVCDRELTKMLRDVIKKADELPRIVPKSQLDARVYPAGITDTSSLND